MSRATTASVKLHRDLYNREAISEAADSFADFASFEVRGDGEHFVVDVADINPEVEGDVVAEFCNFALANSAMRMKNQEA
ncbi:MAG TPA: HxsD-like protein [Candidatus Acidoferrales bacterium]|nr:HxsD-like protein [Candidatus Acidoferrales bacterium]